MGWFDDNSDQAQAYQYVQDQDSFTEDNQPKLSHELIGGAAAFEAMRMYEKHCAENGDPVDHATAKEIAAGFAGAAVDRIAETKGEDWWDREKAKREARQQVEQSIDDNGYQYNSDSSYQDSSYQDNSYQYSDNRDQYNNY